MIPTDNEQDNVTSGEILRRCEDPRLIIILQFMEIATIQSCIMNIYLIWFLNLFILTLHKFLY